MSRSLEEIIARVKYEIEVVTLGDKKSSDLSDDHHLLGDVGIDSLDFASVMLACEEWLGVSLSEDGIDWRKVQTVRQLAELLHQQR